VLSHNLLSHNMDAVWCVPRVLQFTLNSYPKEDLPDATLDELRT